MWCWSIAMLYLSGLLCAGYLHVCRTIGLEGGCLVVCGCFRLGDCRSSALGVWRSGSHVGLVAWRAEGLEIPSLGGRKHEETMANTMLMVVMMIGTIRNPSPCHACWPPEGRLVSLGAHHDLIVVGHPSDRGRLHWHIGTTWTF